MHVAHDVPKAAPLGPHHADAPAPFGCQIGERFGGQLGRGREAVLQILVALAKDLQIKRDDKGRAFRILGALDQPRDIVFVAHGIKLEPEGFRRRLCHILDRIDGHGRQGEGHAKGFGGAGGFNLSVGVLHAGQPDWGQCHRHRHILPDHLRLGAAPAHIHGDALAQADLFKIGRVLAKGLLCPAARFRVVIEHPRHAAFMQALEVVDGGDHGHGGKFLCIGQMI